MCQILKFSSPRTDRTTIMMMNSGQVKETREVQGVPPGPPSPNCGRVLLQPGSHHMRCHHHRTLFQGVPTMNQRCQELDTHHHLILQRERKQFVQQKEEAQREEVAGSHACRGAGLEFRPGSGTLRPVLQCQGACLQNLLLPTQNPEGAAPLLTVDP